MSCEENGVKHIIDCSLIENLVSEGELIQEDSDGSMFSLSGLKCKECGSYIALYYELGELTKKNVELKYPDE